VLINTHAALFDGKKENAKIFQQAENNLLEERANLENRYALAAQLLGSPDDDKVAKRKISWINGLALGGLLGGLFGALLMFLHAWWRDEIGVGNNTESV